MEFCADLYVNRIRGFASNFWPWSSDSQMSKQLLHWRGRVPGTKMLNSPPPPPQVVGSCSKLERLIKPELKYLSLIWLQLQAPLYMPLKSVICRSSQEATYTRLWISPHLLQFVSCGCIDLTFFPGYTILLPKHFCVDSILIKWHIQISKWQKPLPFAPEDVYWHVSLE